MARNFMNSMKANGWFANLYTNCDFIKSGKFSSSTIKSYDVWLADYSKEPDYACGIQQTGSTGSVPWISGNVDIDTAFGDYPAIIKNGGYNGYRRVYSTNLDIDFENHAIRVNKSVVFISGKSKTKDNKKSEPGYAWEAEQFEKLIRGVLQVKKS